MVGLPLACCVQSLGEVGLSTTPLKTSVLSWRISTRWELPRFQDQGGTGVHPNHIKAFQLAHDRGQMTVRSFYNHYEEPKSAADVDDLLGRMPKHQAISG